MSESKVDELFNHYRQSFDDLVMTRAERNDLRIAIQIDGLDPHDKAVLRSKMFDFAAEMAAHYDVKIVLNWLENAVKTIIGSDQDYPPPVAYFSPGDDILIALKNAIKDAQDKLLICVFAISDDRITQTIKQAHKRKVDVKIITDNYKTEDFGSDIEYLHKLGIPVRVDDSRAHMHHKFVIIDSKVLFTGSYNWTRSAENGNNENVVRLEHPSVIKQYEQEFWHLWKRLEKF